MPRIDIDKLQERLETEDVFQNGCRLTFVERITVTREPDGSMDVTKALHQALIGGDGNLDDLYIEVHGNSSDPDNYTIESRRRYPFNIVDVQDVFELSPDSYQVTVVFDIYPWATVRPDVLRQKHEMYLAEWRGLKEEEVE